MTFNQVPRYSGAVPKRRPERPAPRKRGDARRRLIEAATELILARGYPATTMAEVAKRAGVAVQTVYFTFHTKAALFTAVMEGLAAGPDGPTPVLERAWVHELRDSADPARALALIVEHGTDIFVRLMPVWPSIQAAAAADQDFAERFAVIVSRRREGMRQLLGELAARGAWRAKTTTESVADHFFLLQSPELLHLATTTLGWSIEGFKAWVFQSMVPFLAKAPRGRSSTRGLSFATVLPRALASSP